MDALVDFAGVVDAQHHPIPLAVPAATALVPGAHLREVMAPALPAYLQQTYYWAYLNPRNVRLLDRELVVSVILWGNHRRLRRAAFAELRPGERVLQTGHVYGDFCPALARHLGSRGRLEVVDVAPIQVASCRRKFRGLPQARARRADAACRGEQRFDAACCYFLLHELPDDYKRAVVDSLLASVVPGGKVVFVDYHKPHWLHPLKGITSLVFDTLEPYAKGLWRHEIADFSARAGHFQWSKQTYFGGLFQKVVARRRLASPRAFPEAGRAGRT
jgi:ubiquinone/menaquinone biosynthesis C-methylase UbiE